MMVTFISQCEQKALARSRRVLDAFANRIGERTWQTVITEEGLIAIKKLLRQTATKNSAVACHWMRSRSRTELLWIVGNRRKFNAQGIVPVNITHKKHNNLEWENNWLYLPVVKALVGLAGLLHDWGKASILFQTKLENTQSKQSKQSKQGDPLRHEWVSCLLLQTLVQVSGDMEHDDAWITMLASGNLDEKKIIALISSQVNIDTNPIETLPPFAQLLAWLIMTHHRMPLCLKKITKDKSSDNQKNKPYKEFTDRRGNTIQSVLKNISANWGYANIFADDKDFEERLKLCFTFKNGLLSESSLWLKSIKKWANRLNEVQEPLKELIANGGWRVALHHARLCLMLGDHYYSSLEADKKWQGNSKLFANTHFQSQTRQLNQKLDEHLVRVSEQGLKISQSLARFTTDMAMAYDIKSLKKKSPQGYEWQDLAVEKIKAFALTTGIIDKKDNGWFVVNMASTGCGKTIANAKVMRALSDDGESLRYILALGLRTLTLQTGDEYRNKLGLQADELAVLVGSSAVQELHKQVESEQKDESNIATLGSESIEQLLDEELDFEDAPSAEFLDAIIPPKNTQQAKKNKAFLYKPVLVCTIDHLMAATETTRGGKYILPSLRLLSSDLVIDEVDDFDGKDLIAIGRLIHLAAMLGRKVMISSATIPPALAEGFFNIYQEGWRLHAKFRATSAQVACVWIDEFASKVQMTDKKDSLELCAQYASFHKQFISHRVHKLEQQLVKRKAYIVRCDELYNQLESSQVSELSNSQLYFEKIKKTALELHQHHHTIDKLTGKKVSFGVVRFANIPPCVQLSKHLVNTEWPENFAPKIMAYHSRQVLLIRSEQEKHLAAVLQRKEKDGEMPTAFNLKIIREHLDNTVAENVLFIVVATPVEEVGRDHDFDWAIIEPSSYRSIIQMAGRVHRHRKTKIEQPNIAIMQYNSKALRKDNKPAYCRPGYESLKSYKLATHNLCELVDESELLKSVNAIPRIFAAENLQANKSLVALEHKVMADSLNAYNQRGPQCVQSWLTEHWWLTAVPQQFNRFRESMPDLQVYLIWKNGKAVFCERNEQGDFIDRSSMINLIKNIDNSITHRLWLDKNYETFLNKHLDLKGLTNLTAEERNEAMRKLSERYGELTIPVDENKTFIYSDQFGFCQTT